MLLPYKTQRLLRRMVYRVFRDSEIDESDDSKS